MNLFAAELSLWLSKHPGYRLAKESDSACEELIGINKKDYGKEFTPYRTTGDFDGDMKRDVAVIVVNKTSQKDFRILVFASRIASGEKPLVYGNIIGDDDLGCKGLASKFDKKTGHDILLFGVMNAEGAELIHIPQQIGDSPRRSD